MQIFTKLTSLMVEINTGKSGASCVMLASHPTPCPLCGMTVQPMQTHTCHRPEARRPRRPRVSSSPRP